MTTVDVGMPAYERPHFIAGAIESVLAQTHTDWRLIVSENGPGGGDVEAAVRPFLSDPRITFSATGENLGAPANWTRTLQLGSAPYFSVLQDDDKWDPDFLAKRVAFMERHKDVGFVFAGERKMDQDGREIAFEQVRGAFPPKDIAHVLPQGVYSPREFIKAMYENHLGGIHTPSICSLGVMSRRSALEAVGPYFADSYPFLYWDVHLYLRLALRFPTGFLAVRDAMQRIHHPSITSESDFDGEYWVRWHQFHGEWFRRELPGLELPRGYNEVFAQASIMAALDAVERGDRRKGATYLRRALRRDQKAIMNPRIVIGALGVVAGSRGANVLARVRDARRRSSEKLVYVKA
jgi:glycosyltransferase involved in cell wall biosynthesis